MDDTADHDGEPEGRTTAPMSDYGQRELLVGFAVLAVGAVVAFGVPLAATL